MSKKIITLLSFLLAINFSANARAENVAENLADSFMFKPAITLEYQGMDLNGRGQNDQFKHRLFEQQLKNFDNIVLGLNLRVHKYLGFNLNWSKNTLKNTGLNGFSISDKASINLQNINATSLLYFPIVDNQRLEGFAEIGVSDVNSEIKFTQTSGENTRAKSHETALLYGAGIQFKPFDSNIVFRLGFQKYRTDLGFVNARITTFRGGVVIPF